MKYFLLALAMVSPLAVASGWNCEGEGFRAKVRNSTTSTRTPALFVVSEIGGGTLLTAKYDAISKRNVSNGVRYSAVAGSHDPMSGSAILFVQYREGVEEPLEHGETVYGKLILAYEGGPHKYEVECARYLKND